ncbi:GcrA cell cycle regulator [Mesorhizobium shangrilense]|uniref:GcrA cell cycle regulator n=1 Tax=Mesorhizobium shangrilense TaxID=460060 RepID=A0ABV2D617_9HYPH
MSAYTDTELNEIAAWLKDGLSASKIATRFSALRGSAVSRNAIIGIVHRNNALRGIGFANPKGGRAGGRPRKLAAAAMQDGFAGSVGKRAMQSKRATQSKRARQGGRARQNGPQPEQSEAGQGAPGTSKPARHHKLPPPAWLPPRLFLRETGLVPEGEAFRLKVPAPRPVTPGRPPQVAAMRFIDCLFSRCRAPLDLTPREDPENEDTGARPGPEMLCCGLRTKALKSYCAYHQARFHDHRRTLLANERAGLG